MAEQGTPEVRLQGAPESLIYILGSKSQAGGSASLTQHTSSKLEPSAPSEGFKKSANQSNILSQTRDGVSPARFRFSPVYQTLRP